MSDYEKEIKELKKDYPTLFKLEIPMDEGDKVLLLRKLDRVTYSAGLKLMEKDELQAAEFFLRSLTVGGDSAEDVIKDFEALRIASGLLVNVIGTKSGNVQKL
jgi:hypothetical protein